MAIHVGDADERDGDYFGPTVNRVARLLALGHGGQVLVSGVAMQLAGSPADTDLGWLELGTFGLKDLREPERVFQLTAPGLPREFKALVSAGDKPGNLPRATTSFVGRRQDAERLAELLRAGGLVTLVGTGGVGKTRLAIHSAERVDGVPDGTWLVELAPLSAPALRRRHGPLGDRRDARRFRFCARSAARVSAQPPSAAGARQLRASRR